VKAANDEQKAIPVISVVFVSLRILRGPQL